MKNQIFLNILSHRIYYEKANEVFNNYYELSGVNIEEKVFILQTIYENLKSENLIYILRNQEFLDDLIKNSSELLEFIRRDKGKILLDISKNGMLFRMPYGNKIWTPLLESDLEKVNLFLEGIVHPLTKKYLQLALYQGGVCKKNQPLDHTAFIIFYKEFLKSPFYNYDTHYQLIPLMIYNTAYNDQEIAQNLKMMEQEITLKSEHMHDFFENNDLALIHAFEFFNQLKFCYTKNVIEFNLANLQIHNYKDEFINGIYSFLYSRAILDEKPLECIAKIQKSIETPGSPISTNIDNIDSAWLLINFINNKQVTREELKSFNKGNDTFIHYFPIKQIIFLLRNLSLANNSLNQKLPAIVDLLCQSDFIDFFQAEDIDFKLLPLDFMKDGTSKEKLQNFLNEIQNR